MMKRLLTLFLVCAFSLGLVGCAGVDEDMCYKLKCDAADATCQQPMPKINYNGKPLGTISYIVTVVQDKIGESSKIIFENITGNADYKKVVRGMMTLFIAMYGIAIALGIAQPSPLELVIRVAKMTIIFYLLGGAGGGYANFEGMVHDFFEGLTHGLSSVFTTAIVSSAGGGGGAVTDLDVFNFIDTKILGLLLSVRFTTLMGALLTISGVGMIVGLLLFSVILQYIWTLVMAVQIYIMSAIARALLYALAPVFIIFLLFKQTQSLFEGWLKQLINFSLQPVLLVGFLAFFNGIFFNYLDTMFKPDFKVCAGVRDKSGQVWHLSDFYLAGPDGKRPEKEIQISETVDMFTLFVVVMLGTIMVKMNQWAVQSAAQLSEGGITFGNTMAANAQMAGNITQGAGKVGREVFMGKGAPPK